MELRTIRIFALAAKYLNFSKVADNMFLSQSSVSKTISSLEDELGHELFRRDTKNVSLTEFGRQFLPYALNLLEREEQANDFLNNYNHNQITHPIFLGVANSLVYSPPRAVLYRLIKSFNKMKICSPASRINMKYLPDEELMLRLQESQIDMAVMPCTTQLTFMLNKHGIECSVPEDSDNYLLYSPVMGDFDSLYDLAPHINTVTFSHDPLPKNLTHSLMQDLGIHPSVLPCENWSEMFFNILENKACGIVPSNLISLAADCNLRWFELGETYSTCLAIMWINSKKYDHVIQFIDILEEELTVEWPDNPLADKSPMQDMLS